MAPGNDLCVEFGFADFSSYYSSQIRDSKDESYKQAFNSLVDRVSEEFEEVARNVQTKLQFAEKR